MNEFSTAAFRIGHALLNEDFPLIDKKNHSYQVFKLDETFMKPKFFKTEENIDDAIRGIARTLTK